MDFSFMGLVRGRSADLHTFSNKVDIEPDDLLPRIAFKDGPLYRIQSETVALCSSTGLRFCPHCAVDDELTAAGPRGFRAYGRTNWLIEASRTCPIHLTALVTSDTIPERNRSHDFAALLRLERTNLDRYRVISVPTCRDSLDIYIGNRIADATPPDLWLNALPLHVVARLAEYTGAIERHGVNFMYPELDELERSACAGAGFTILAEGIPSFQLFLKTLHAPYFDRKYPVGGSALYGRLYAMLKREQSNPSYDVVRNIVRETALDFLPLGDGDEFLGPVEGRRWHSMITAAREFGVHPTRVQKILECAGLVTHASSRLTYNKILVNAPAASDCLTAFGEALTAGDAMDRLNAPQESFRCLVNAGLIKCVGPIEGFPGLQERYDPTEVDSLLLRMQSLVTKEPDETMVSLRKARRVTQTTTRQIQDLLFGGKLKSVGLDASERGYLSIRVNADEIFELTRLTNVGVISIREAERKLRQQAVTVRALINAGLLKTVRMKNSSGRFQNFVSSDEVERFETEYVSLPQLARHHAIPRETLKSRLIFSRVRPVLPPAEIGATYFRASEIPEKF